MNMEKILQEANPVAESPESRPLDAIARRSLQRILDPASDQGIVGSRQRPRRGLFVAAAAVACLTVMALVGGALVARPETGAAATPPLLIISDTTQQSAPDVLRTLAAKVRSQGSDQQASPNLVVHEWALWTRVSGHVVKSAIIPTRMETRCTTEGSCVTTTAMVSNASMSLRDRLLVVKGSIFGEEDAESRRTWSLGNDGGFFQTNPPAEREELWQYLTKAHPVNEHGTSELLVAISDLHRQWRPAAATRSAILETLATRDDIVWEGPTTDRLGRSSLAFSVSSKHGGLPNKKLILIDPNDGRVLGVEEILTQTPGKLNVEIPATISYKAFD